MKLTTFDYAHLPHAGTRVAPTIEDYKEEVRAAAADLADRSRPWRNNDLQRWRNLVRLRRGMDETLQRRADAIRGVRSFT